VLARTIRGGEWPVSGGKIRDVNFRSWPALGHFAMSASDPSGTVSLLKSNGMYGMDAPILLIGIVVPKWRCE
jgi:hypothetical protein